MEPTNLNNSGSILDVILEKCSNTEHSTNGEIVRRGLNEILRVHAKREKTLRESTITLKTNEKFQLQDISEIIEREWVAGKKQVPTTYWADKTSVYVQFASRAVKNLFLDFATTILSSDFKDCITKPNSEGEHVTRRPIRVVMNNVRGNIKAERVEEILKTILSDKEHKMEDFREGKLNMLKSRSIMFNINSEAFKTLFGVLDGALPYTNTQTNTKTRLFMKINCKPWLCRECFAIGNHQCEGRKCAQCGMTGHATKDCKQKTKYCANCKQRGHRAKDVHCPAYLNEVSKEIRKMAFPIESFEDKELRFNLTKHIQLK